MIHVILIFGFFGQDKDEYDTQKSNELQLEALSDADKNRKVEAITGKRWRDQVDVEQAEDMRKQAELLKMGKRRN